LKGVRGSVLIGDWIGPAWSPGKKITLVIYREQIRSEKKEKKRNELAQRAYPQTASVVARGSLPHRAPLPIGDRGPQRAGPTAGIDAPRVDRIAGAIDQIAPSPGASSIAVLRPLGDPARDPASLLTGRPS
jgi:hypothetical protein